MDDLSMTSRRSRSLVALETPIQRPNNETTGAFEDSDPDDAYL